MQRCQGNVRRASGGGRGSILARVPCLLLLAACAGPCAARSAEVASDPGQILAEWPVVGAALPAQVSLYERAGTGGGATLAADPTVLGPDGVTALRVEVHGHEGGQPTDIQVTFLARQDLCRGGRYRVSFQVKASRPARFDAMVIHDDPPWGALAPTCRTVVEAGLGWSEQRIEFSPEADVTGEAAVRSPCLALGLVPAGTTLWVAGVTLWELEAPPPPLPVLRSAELLQNPSFEDGLHDWQAQAAEIAASRAGAVTGDLGCLVTQRSARWGSPVQSVRAALQAQGRGFYEFGAAVRCGHGHGAAFVVIHTRDAVGERWFVSPTRAARAGAFARPSGQRFVSWTGDLAEADISVQTSADDTGDIVVDDVSLRALPDLARGRPCISSGDLAGAAAALAIDGDPATAWQGTAAGENWLEVDLGEARAFNACVLEAGGAPSCAYEIQIHDGQWRTVFAGGDILGPADEIHFAPQTARRVRLRFAPGAPAPLLRGFALYATASREQTLRLPRPAADAAQRGPRTLVGAIRWDGWCGEGNRVGLELEHVLAPEKYHHRLPFYAEVLGAEQIRVRCISAGVIDREIAFAKEAGLDYWAFDWYPPGSGLDTARALYLASPRRTDINWCAVLGTNAFGEADLNWLIEQFRTPIYQKVLGVRPLVYVFDASRKAAPLVQSLRTAAANAGLAAPFIIFMGWGAAIAEPAAACGADALGAYVNPLGGPSTFAANMAHERRLWDALLLTGRQLAPTVTTGWDPRPFLERPVSWYHGATEANWVEAATPAEIEAQLRAALAWVEAQPQATLANTVLIYAWNENAEGGWIVPTLAEARAGVGPLRLAAVRRVLRPELPESQAWPDLTAPLPP